MRIATTAVSSKDTSGFKVNGDDKKGGVFDTLIDRYCAELCEHPYDPSCPKDYGRVEPFGGFYSYATDPDCQHRYRSHSTTTRFLTRVGINRRRATAQDEMLYSIEVLNESFLRDTKAKYQKWEYFAYRSSIWVKDPVATSLQEFINRHSETFRIGSGVSRGLGRVQIKAEVKSPKSTLKERIQKFNQALKERRSLWSVIKDEQFPSDRTFFTLDLQSDAILCDRWQRTMVVSPEMLVRGNGVAKDSDAKDSIAGDDVQLHTSYATYGYRSGWERCLGIDEGNGTDH